MKNRFSQPNDVENERFFFNPPPLKLGKFDQNCATYGEFETYFLRFFEFAMAVGFINGNFEQKQIISANIE